MLAGPSSGACLRAEYSLALPVFATRLVYLGTLTLLPVLLAERGIAPQMLAVLVGVYGYAAVAMDLLAGVLADRFAPARLAAIGSLGVVGAIGLLLASAQVLVVGAARLLHGVAMGLFRPSITALVLERVDESRRAAAVSINNVAYVAGASVGPLFAGVLADRLGVEWALAACAGVACVAVFHLIAFVRSGPRLGRPRPVWASLKGLPGLVRTRSLVAPMLLVHADQTILHLWLVFLPLYLIQQHGFSLTAAGALVGLEALLYSLAQPIWGRLLDRRGYAIPAAISLLAHGALIAALPLAGGDWIVLVALLGACGALNAGAYPGSVALAAGRIRPEERGRAMGLLAAGSDLGQVLGPLLAGLAYQLTGRFEAAFVLGLPVAVAGLAAAWASDRGAGVR